MSGCGLKNSLCSSPSWGEGLNTTTNSNNSFTVEDDSGVQRFLFVDQNDGLWSNRINYPALWYPSNSTTTDPAVIDCPSGASVVFYYPQNVHDLVQLASATHYATCNFTDAVTLSPRNYSNDTFAAAFPFVSYYFSCLPTGSISYLTCSVPGHCQGGQKITVRVSNSVYAQHPDTGDWLVHVRSLPRLLRLLGYRRDSSSGGVIVLDRGFQTEALAALTHEWIWCALDECPQAARGLPGITVAQQDDAATNVTCQSTVYTLLGYLNRQRPIPVYHESVEYYLEAIELGGPNECTARSYLASLYLLEPDHNVTAANLSLNELCTHCGSSSSSVNQGDPNQTDVTSILQTWQDYQKAQASTWVTWPDVCTRAMNATATWPASDSSSSAATRRMTRPTMGSNTAALLVLGCLWGRWWRGIW